MKDCKSCLPPPSTAQKGKVVMQLAYSSKLKQILLVMVHCEVLNIQVTIKVLLVHCNIWFLADPT